MADETARPAPEQQATEPESAAASNAPAPEASPAAGAPAEPRTAGPSAGEAWSSVIVAIADLGDAVAAWARAAADDPENRRHVEEVRASVNDMAKNADAAFSGMADTDFGKQVRKGADDAGQVFADTAQKMSDAAAPHVASAFAGLADVFGRAAQKAGEAAAQAPTAKSASGPQHDSHAEPPEAASASDDADGE
jgi:hypothetical protein